MNTTPMTDSVPIREFMVKEIVKAQSYESIKDVCKKMYSKNVSSAVVLKDGDPFGIVTYTDIAIAVTNFEKSIDLPISEIISSNLVHVGPDESVLDVAEKMTKTNTHHILVMQNNTLLGIVSSSDLVVVLSALDEGYIFEKLKPYLHSQG